MKITKNITLLLILAFVIYVSTNKALFASTKVLKKETVNQEQKIEKKEAASSDTVVIETEKGPIKIKLFVKEAPITSGNFIELAKKGFYNGTIFHRVIDGFVIQGGDPLGDGTGNYIDPNTGKPRFIKLETNPNLKFDKKGRIGMARTSDPNSASCQFFIGLQPLPSLDPGGVDVNGYAVFGQVSEETLDTLDKIVKDSKPTSPGSDRPAKPVKMLKFTFQ
jgi:cyclophilin family peptidyl-prolyl cis-trans isomerase